MSGYGSGSTTGGMQPEGQTTEVGVSADHLSPKDREVLCQTFCKCKAIGLATPSGRVLRQRCVEQRLDTVNAVSKIETGSPTEYRPEQPYDMTTDPPSPIMDYDDPMEPHSSVREWIRNVWPSKGTTYRSGDVRRPDVVIVNDPTQPPVQSNLRNVVEMKFPGDRYRPDQEDDYIEIAGAHAKFVHLGAAECGCGDEKGQKQGASSKQRAHESDLDELYGGGRNAPGGPPLPPMGTGPAPFPAPVW